MAQKLNTFLKLRGVMTANGDQQEDLAKVLLMTQQSVSNRFSLRSAWTLNDMYAVMDHYNLPYSQLHVYFPPNGTAQS